MAGTLLAGCRPGADEGEQPRTPVLNNAATERPRLPIAEPPLDRAALLHAAAQAASAAALGVDDRQAQSALEGDRFELRIRFGCPGIARPGAPGPFRVRFEPDTRTLRLSAAPDLSLDEPWVAALAGEGVEAVEGFWMRRPWLLAPGCPATAARPPAQAPPGETTAAPAPGPEQAQSADAPAPTARLDHRVGIAQFFTEADPRTRRRDSRAYEATATLPEGKQPSPQGYDLVLSGRLRQLAGGRVIACHVTSLDAPPDCVIAAEFDRVWIERPDSKELLAEWGGG